MGERGGKPDAEEEGEEETPPPPPPPKGVDFIGDEASPLRAEDAGRIEAPAPAPPPLPRPRIVPRIVPRPRSAARFNRISCIFICSSLSARCFNSSGWLRLQ